MQGIVFSSLFAGAFRQCLLLNHTRNSSSSFTNAIKDLKKKNQLLLFMTPKCTVIFHAPLEVHIQLFFHSLSDLGLSHKKYNNEREAQRRKCAGIDTPDFLIKRSAACSNTENSCW